MTFKVLKSQMPEGFEAAVARHAQEMQRWRAQEERVAADKKAGVKGDKIHMAYPRPSAHPLVRDSVNESDVADYEIVDDGPTPEQILANKKVKLIAWIMAAEQAAIRVVVPLGKERAWNLRLSDINQADAAARQKITSDIIQAASAAADKKTGGILSATAVAVGLKKPVVVVAPKPIDIEAAVVSARPAADTAFLADNTARQQKVDAIQRAAAQMMSDVEDLTATNIDSWKMPDFPK
jgi:hypothetical protein